MPRRSFASSSLVCCLFSVTSESIQTGGGAACPWKPSRGADSSQLVLPEELVSRIAGLLGFEQACESHGHLRSANGRDLLHQHFSHATVQSLALR